MARLILNKDAKAFFDVKLSLRGSDIWAVAQLRVPKTDHCSGFLVHDEFMLGDKSHCEKLFCQKLNSSEDTLEFRHAALRFILGWKEGGSAEFKSVCDGDECTMAICKVLSTEEVKTFIKRLTVVMGSIAKNKKSRGISCDRA